MDLDIDNVWLQEYQNNILKIFILDPDKTFLETTVPEKISSSSPDPENNVIEKHSYIINCVKLPLILRPKLLNGGRNSILGGRADSWNRVHKKEQFQSV